MFNCADGVLRWIFPIILILSADYEEQWVHSYNLDLPIYLIIHTYHLSSRCVMALIRGTNSHYPCPVCLVPAEDLSNLSKVYPLRTTEKMKEVYETAQRAETMAEKEALLKDYGLRNVEVS